MTFTKYIMLIPVAFLSCSSTATAQESESSRPAIEVDLRIQRFVENYCVTCHNANEQSGKVRFDKLDHRITNSAVAQQWRDLLDILNTGEMPPDEATRRPSQNELADVIGALTEDVAKALRMLRGKGGETAARRLNRIEYINSVKALTGILLPKQRVPADENGNDFNTLGWYQTFSPGMLEAYQEAADFAVRTMLLKGDRPIRDKSLTRIDNPKSKLFERAKERKDDALWQALYNHYTSNPRHKTGLLIYKAEHKWSPYNLRIADYDFRGEYKIRARVAVDESMSEDLRFLRVTQEGTSPIFFSLKDAISSPKVVEFTTQSDFEGKVVFAHLMRPRLRPGTTKNLKRGKPVPTIWIDWIEVEGPIYSGRHVRIRRQLLQGVDEQQLALSDARLILNRFATRAFRGSPVTPEFISDLLVIFEQESKSGKSHLEALAKPMTVILTTPQFLYLTENKSHQLAPTSPTQLASHEMATRLSFMLWKEPPSDALLTAGNRLLNDREFLEATFDKMMANPRFDRFVDEFFGQWLGLSRFDEIQLDTKSSEGFDLKIRQAVRRQPLEFIKLIIEQDLSLTSLIDSEFSVLDQSMTQYYGDLATYQDDFAWNDFDRVQLTPRNRHRGGLLGMPAIQIMGSSGVETSPVERGAWIARTLLNAQPPPPPPNVPQLTVDPKLTVRESLERHKQIVQCYSCHRKIDDMGLALENFDAIGRWRDQYSSGTTIETTGLMPDGARFRDAKEMKTRLLDHKDRMIQSMVEALIAYSLSRESEFTDQDFIDRVVKHARDKGYRLKPLLRAFVSSKTFTHK